MLGSYNSKQDRDVGVTQILKNMGNIPARFRGEVLSEGVKGQKRSLGDDSEDDEDTKHMNSPQR